MPDSRRPYEPGKNKLLDTLPKRVRDDLMPQLRPVALRFGETLHEPDGVIRHVFFPTSGMIALLMILKDGSAVEVGRIGNEGMVGLPVFLGVTTSHTKALVQIDGDALSMKAHVFRKLARRDGPLGARMLRYTQALMRHASQLTACNSWHTVEQRLCRWLLITNDRVQADQLEVTQAFLSQMLGVHRQSVTLAASNLQRKGVIRYRRGKLTILDRHGLETACCECYRAIQSEFDQLLAAVDR